MKNHEVWEREYGEFKLIVDSSNDKPQADLARFLRGLKKARGADFANWQVLDLGSGTGRNAVYLAGLGCRVVGLELSAKALAIANDRARNMEVDIDFRQFDIGTVLPFPDNHFDLVIDVTSSNSLDERGRGIYLEEVKRILKRGGRLFVRALAKDGDKNAKNLLNNFPGAEPDTYIMPEVGLIERVFSRDDFVDLYGQFFEVEELIKKIGYTKLNNQSYKRCFWIAHLINE